MLPAHPFRYLFYKRIGSKDADHRAEGENVNEKLRFVHFVIVDRTDPSIVLAVIFRMFFVTSKMEHAPFQGVAFFADRNGQRFCNLKDREVKPFFVLGGTGGRGQMAGLDPLQV